VFYFALSAMLFRFSANLSLGEVLDWRLVAAYLAASLVVYLLATLVAMLRGLKVETAAIEAQCAVIGNVGFLGIPMLAMLMGEAAVGPVMLVLAVDLLVFGSLVVILITGARDGRMSPAILRSIGGGLIRNPMIVSIAPNTQSPAIAQSGRATCRINVVCRKRGRARMLGKAATTSTRRVARNSINAINGKISGCIALASGGARMPTTNPSTRTSRPWRASA